MPHLLLQTLPITMTAKKFGGSVKSNGGSVKNSVGSARSPHWLSERESLLREVSELKLKIQALERQKSMQGASISETIANVVAMLQVLKDAELNSTVGQIAESGSSASPMLLEAKEIVQEEEKKEVVVKEVRNFEREIGVVKKVNRKALRKGSEGEEVRVMQVCLQSAYLL